MKHIITLLLCISVVYTQTKGQISIVNTDIIPVIGSWQGSLEYLDYTSKKHTVIPATLDIEQVKTGVFTFAHQFPKEPQVNWIDTIALTKDGSFFGKGKIIEKEVLADGMLIFVTEEVGEDDTRAALVHKTYGISDKEYFVKKEVQYTGSNEWLQRHEYRYNVRAKFLTPQQMKADLALIKTTWEQIHPGLYRYNTKAEIDGYFNELDKKTNRILEQREFFILVSQLNIKLRCGHSFVSYYNNKRLLKYNLYSNVFIPILFTVVDKKFIITHNLSNDPKLNSGDEIAAINGISTKIIIDSLLTVSKADGKNGLNKQLDNISLAPREIYTDRYTLFDIFFPLFFKENLNESSYKITVRNQSGKEKQVLLEGLSKEARQAAYIKRFGDLPRDEKSWYVKPVNKETIIFRIGDFMTYKWKFDFNKYLDSVFVMMNAKGYKNLIVDIRNNEGGADDARNAVLSYLTPKDLGCAMPYRRLYRYNHVPDSLNKYLDTWDDNFRKRKPDSLYIKTAEGYYESRNPDKCIEITSNPNHFRGKIYLITDVTNSSATFTMADVFQQNQLGTIVGETTGGTKQGINGGEIFFFNLPNSKIEMDLPLIYQAPKVNRPDEGIRPNVEIKTTVKDVIQNRDPQVAYILRILLKHHAK